MYRGYTQLMVVKKGRSWIRKEKGLNEKLCRNLEAIDWRQGGGEDMRRALQLKQISGTLARKCLF